MSQGKTYNCILTQCHTCTVHVKKTFPIWFGSFEFTVRSISVLLPVRFASVHCSVCYMHERCGVATARARVENQACPIRKNAGHGTLHFYTIALLAIANALAAKGTIC